MEITIEELSHAYGLGIIDAEEHAVMLNFLLRSMYANFSDMDYE